MKTMEQIDAWYEGEINKARLEGELKGKIESVITIIRGKFGALAFIPQIGNQIEALNSQQLDEFILGIFNLQEPEEIEKFLGEIVSRNQ